ncbi:MAG: ribosome assembly RNA-binding protein YhbY [Firmicutes bacterium]|nr:ribosome assembly RNA-binding protein YhbY [Bacillota bacterium]
MLTSKERARLRSLGNELEPIFQIGKGGVTDEIINQLDQALTARELIKVRVLKNSLEEPREAAEKISAATDSEVVQVIGRNFILYREKVDGE